MAASDQKRRFDLLPATSSLPRTTDINRPARLVRFVPTTDIAVSFDHLVGTGQKHWGHFQAERLCGLQIDDELELD
jgi:hypothetical protein